MLIIEWCCCYGIVSPPPPPPLSVYVPLIFNPPTPTPPHPIFLLGVLFLLLACALHFPFTPVTPPPPHPPNMFSVLDWCRIFIFFSSSCCLRIELISDYFSFQKAFSFLNIILCSKSVYSAASLRVSLFTSHACFTWLFCVPILETSIHIQKHFENVAANIFPFYVVCILLLLLLLNQSVIYRLGFRQSS